MVDNDVTGLIMAHMDRKLEEMALIFCLHIPDILSKLMFFHKSWHIQGKQDKMGEILRSLEDNSSCSRLFVSRSFILIGFTRSISISTLKF